MKKRIKVYIAAMLMGLMLTACGSAATTELKETEGSVDTVADAIECPLEDGSYTVTFNSDSSMFHVNEACDGKGTLTVENGQMTLHISLASKKIINLYPGFAEDAKAEGAVLLEPTTDTITYDDGMTDEVYGFDVPVTDLDTDFNIAILGSKGNWYDHVVSITDAEPIE